MSSPTSFGNSMLFQTINDDLNASLATADELSREFDSMLKEASSNNAKSQSETTITISREKPQSPRLPSTVTSMESRGRSTANSSSQPFSPSTVNSFDSIIPSNTNVSPSPVFFPSPHTSPKLQREARSPLPQVGSDCYSYGQQSPKQTPHSPRRSSPFRYGRSPVRGTSVSHMERSPSPSPTTAPMDQSSRFSSFVSQNRLSPYDSNLMSQRSHQPDRNPSPLYFNQPTSNTLPPNYGGNKQHDQGMQQPKSPSKWNETDLDVTYERKPHHTYDKTEWLRPSMPNSSWRESNLDGPPPTTIPQKYPRTKPIQFPHGSLPRSPRVSVQPNVSSPVHSPYQFQPITSRISIPPTSSLPRQRRPIPLSIIMRLQNPRWRALETRHPRVLAGEGDMPYQLPPTPREFFKKPLVQPQPELRSPVICSDVLNSGDVDAELEGLDYVQHLPRNSEKPGMPEGSGEVGQGVQQPARPLSPSKLQPVVAPEAQIQEIPDLEELLRVRAEIPRALKKRGSVDPLQPLKKASLYQPNQYKNLIDKLFRRKERRQRGERGSESSSSSDGEDVAMPPAILPQSKSSLVPLDFRSYHSILRRSKREHTASGRRARLSPLVLLLDGALVGELETVQRAVQEMNDPSQPNDEGITALHNAICGGHYKVVDLLVRIGANVSAPDSHGWTPLHCSASCNDRPLCEFLVRNGAAVMARTQSDGATASQKCDPYAEGFEECESFLRGVEEAMGLENSGVMYALWSYPAQAADELSFREGDMVTILQKPEGSDWWWASLCGREGFVPNNYFGLFPKIRPKTLC